MPQKVNNTFKILYILAIIMIVDGHIGHYDYLNFNNLLRYQNYHIALFIFTAGYFLNLNYSPKEFFLRKFSHLIVPLYLWNLFYGLICFFLNHYLGFNLGAPLNLYNLFYAPLVDGHQFIYNLGSWFLVPLFGVQMVGYFCLKPFANRRIAGLPLLYINFLILSLILSFVTLQYAPSNAGKANICLTFLRIGYFLPAFAFGVCYRHLLEKYDTLNTPLYLFIILTLVSLLCQKYQGYNHIPSWLNEVNAPAFAIYAISFLAILFWIRVAKVLTPIYQKSKSLKYIADHTFDIMMHHFAGFMLIKAAFSSLPNFNSFAYKNDIWYYYYPFSEELSAWFYIFITIALSLVIGYISRTILPKIKQLESQLKA